MTKQSRIFNRSPIRQAEVICGSEVVGTENEEEEKLAESSP